MSFGGMVACQQALTDAAAKETGAWVFGFWSGLNIISALKQARRRLLAGPAGKLLRPNAGLEYDLGTAISAAASQGANNVVSVRATDGTDGHRYLQRRHRLGTAITYMALYTGTLGNGIVVCVANGNAANSYAVTIAGPGLTPETFNNVTGTGNAFWVNLAAAINAGQSGSAARPRSSWRPLALVRVLSRSAAPSRSPAARTALYASPRPHW